jgi:hypothetical protein
MVFELTRRQSLEDAHALWQIHCPDVPGNLVWDGQLTQLTNDPVAVSDFRWKLLSSGDLAVNRMEGQKGPCSKCPIAATSLRRFCTN